MSTVKLEIRKGTYYDSVVLMQLQAALAKLPGISNVGVMMGTQANKDLLAQTDLLTEGAENAWPDDLIIAVQGDDPQTADIALQQVDKLLAQRRTASEAGEYIPQSLETALKMAPESKWVLVSTPGRYAAELAHQALISEKHVFLYSDNVSLEDELRLKKRAAEAGLFLMGPDCGTAIINGFGLGFANQVQRGPIGVVAASGTGLQQVTTRIHQLGSGITHALGTGGRDLSEEIAAITTRQGLELLNRDPETKVIVLISKPPAPPVAQALLRLSRIANKPVVINFIGYTPPSEFLTCDNLHFASTLDSAAKMAVELTEKEPDIADDLAESQNFAPKQQYLRGLFSGGTLAYEALLILQDYLPVVYSNTPLDKAYQLRNPLTSQGHTIIDLGDDTFTVGRLHPMMDNTLRLQRLEQEAADPEVAVILLDVVLGYGAHPDPAGKLAPAIAQAIQRAQEDDRTLKVVAMVTGTAEDPQNMAEQIDKLCDVGCLVETSSEAAARYVGRLLQPFNNLSGLPPIDLESLNQPLQAINVGLEIFKNTLDLQEAVVLPVNWRPPAGGNQQLMNILARMKKG